MLRSALTRRGNRHLMIALTVALGACVATSMLSVMFNVGDKVNQELKSYGANIVVRPQGAALLDDLYSTGEATEARSYLREDELGNIKTIFWTYNILDFAPLLSVSATDASGEHVPTTGSATTSSWPPARASKPAWISCAAGGASRARGLRTTTIVVPSWDPPTRPHEASASGTPSRSPARE